MLRIRLGLAFGLTLLAGAHPAAAASVEETLNGRWRGAWALTRVPLRSDCAGFYTDNELQGASVRSGGDRRFDEGELVRVERVDLKRGRIDLFLDVAEGVLRPVADGPFTLYEERSCRAQLQVPQPREALADAARAGSAVERLLELQPTRAAAEDSQSWNGRRREPYPPDYERTLAEHAAWKASQTNAAVQARIEDATGDALRMTDRVDDDPEYLQGLAAGVGEARDRYLSNDCATLLGSRFEGFSESPPSGRSEEWRRGFSDGQRLVYDLELVGRLPRCFVPVPSS
jgi:hypothetical protein